MALALPTRLGPRAPTTQTSTTPAPSEIAREPSWQGPAIVSASGDVVLAAMDARISSTGTPVGVVTPALRFAGPAFHAALAGLDPLVREVFVDVAVQHPRCVRDVVRLLRGPAASFAPETLLLVASRVRGLADRPRALAAFVAAVSLPAVASLTREDRERLVVRAGARGVEVGGAWRRFLVDARALSPEKLAAALHKERGLPFRTELVRRTHSNVRVVARHAVRARGERIGSRVIVDVGGHRVEIRVPSRRSVGLPVMLAALARLPPFARACLDCVRAIRLEQRDVGDAMMLADRSGLLRVMPGSPDAAFIATTLVHEIGHMVAFAHLGRDSWATAGWQRWMTAVAGDSSSPSRYGRTNPDEDFAETFAIYVAVLGTAREADARAMMTGRFAILDEIVRATEPGHSALRSA